MNSECFRRMIDRFKALRAGPEKRAKAIDAIVSDDGCHIRKHDETDAVRMARSSHQRRLTAARGADQRYRLRSEEHTSELQSLMRSSYAVLCLQKQHTKPDYLN